MTVTILLLQARHKDDPAKAEELTSFAQKAALPVSAFSSHDLLTGPPTLSEVQRHSALMVGGSGEYYVSKGNLPHFQATLLLFKVVVNAGHPTFASCFGFHLLTVALGGEIVYDPENMELGTYPVTLTAAGEVDELFSNLPSVFQAQLGHKDRAARLPDSVVNLAASAKVKHQAFRIPGKPIWATQFHPELTGEENRTRFYRYREGYAEVLNLHEQDQTLGQFTESPETNLLIPSFLDLIQKSD